MQWGLIGGEGICQKSLAKDLWNEIFSQVDIDSRHFCHGLDSREEAINKIKQIKQSNDIKGFNVARPWKGVAFDLCDEVEPIANVLKTVNTVIKKGSKLHGYNTDGIGIIKAIVQKTNLIGKSVLILGCGGAAQTVPYYLHKEGVKNIFATDIENEKFISLVNKYSEHFPEVDIKKVNREDMVTYLDQVDIVINATPCGMLNYPDKYPFEITDLYNSKSKPSIVEMVYNPALTPFLENAHMNGNEIISGISMLTFQALESFKLAYGESSYNVELLKKKCLEGVSK